MHTSTPHDWVYSTRQEVQKVFGHYNTARCVCGISCLTHTPGSTTLYNAVESMIEGGGGFPLIWDYVLFI